MTTPDPLQVSAGVDALMRKGQSTAAGVLTDTLKGTAANPNKIGAEFLADAPSLPAGSNPNIPANLTITGITTPSGSGSLTLPRIADQNSYPAWGGNVGGRDWEMQWVSGIWYLYANGGTDYLSQSVSTAISPVGLTFESPGAGAGIAVVAGDAPIGQFIGQQLRVGAAGGPFTWYRWNGEEWAIDETGSATVDNASVNAAIAENPTASRTAMQAAQEGGAMSATSVTASSLAVAALPLRSMLEQRIWSPTPSSLWLVNEGTVAVGVNASHFKMLTAASTDSTNILRTDATTESFPMMHLDSTVGNGGNIDFSKEVWASYKFDVVTATSTSIIKGWCGVTYTGVGNPDGRGFGFEIRNLALYITAFGASYVISADPVSTLLSNRTQVLILRKLANGTVEAHLNGVLVGTLAGGPAVTVSGCGFRFSQTTGATATAVRFRLAAPVLYVAP
jgi:hypothetical protein